MRWSQQQVLLLLAGTPVAVGHHLVPCCWFSSAEKDVNRTDRTNRFYEGMDNPGLVLLHDILMTYCMYDFDLGERKLPASPRGTVVERVLCEHDNAHTRGGCERVF